MKSENDVENEAIWGIALSLFGVGAFVLIIWLVTGYQFDLIARIGVSFMLLAGVIIVLSDLTKILYHLLSELRGGNENSSDKL